MRERMEAVGSQLTVFSEKGVGTRLFAVLPIDAIIEGRETYEVY